jgi:serine/threonine protein kinase
MFCFLNKKKYIYYIYIIVVIILFALFLISRPGKESDIWSLGILLFFLIEMRYPYQSFYKQMNGRQQSIEIKNEIKKGLVKDGKVNFFLKKKNIYFF